MRTRSSLAAVILTAIGLLASTSFTNADDSSPVNRKPAKDLRRTLVLSQVGAKLDSNVETGGGTDQTELIQSLLDRALEHGSVHLIVDGAVLVRGLKVHSNTTIECLNRACGFFLADGANYPLIRNSNPQTAARENKNISFLGGTYNGNAIRQKHDTPQFGFTSVFALHGVEQLLFRDVTITNSATFAVWVTNWRRIVFENIYINLTQLCHNQDGIHLQGPGQFLSMKNIQGRSWDDFIALNADDADAEWNLDGKFTMIDRLGPYSSFGPITDVDIDGVHLDDASHAIRILSRASRVDRVSIKNVSGTYRCAAFWMTPHWREGGNLGRIEFKNIDVRAVAPNPFEWYFPPFVFNLGGRIENLTIRNLHSYLPIDGRPLVWIQPDAKIDVLRLHGINVYDTKMVAANEPLVRACGNVDLLQVRDVMVYRPQAAATGGCLIRTGLERDELEALKVRLDRVADYLRTDPKTNRRGWPEAYRYLTARPKIDRLQVQDVVADKWENVVKHKAGTIGRLDLSNVTAEGVKELVKKAPDAQIGSTRSGK